MFIPRLFPFFHPLLLNLFPSIRSLPFSPLTVTFPLLFSLSHLLLSLSPSFLRFAYLMTEALEAAHTR